MQQSLFQYVKHHRSLQGVHLMVREDHLCGWEVVFTLCGTLSFLKASSGLLRCLVQACAHVVAATRLRLLVVGRPQAFETCSKTVTVMTFEPAFPFISGEFQCNP